MTKSPKDSAYSAFALSRRGLLKGSAGLAAAGLVTALLPSGALAAGEIVALVHTQAAGDNGPVDSMIAKLSELAKEKGFEAKVVYAADPATYETIFRTLGDAGASIIVSTFNEVAEPFKALAPSYPNTNWNQLFAHLFEPALPNVVTVSYDYYLGCYLSGMFGALTSKTGKLGYIGGLSLPPLNADANAIKAGATSVKPAAPSASNPPQAARSNSSPTTHSTSPPAVSPRKTASALAPPWSRTIRPTKPGASAGTSTPSPPPTPPGEPEPT